MKPENKTVSQDVSDAELSALVAEHCAGWKPNLPCGYCTNPTGMVMSQASLPPYATSANDVIPLLQQRGTAANISYCSVQCMWFIEIVGHKASWKGAAEDFARSACFALLASHGFTITYNAGREAGR